MRESVSQTFAARLSRPDALLLHIITAKVTEAAAKPRPSRIVLIRFGGFGVAASRVLFIPWRRSTVLVVRFQGRSTLIFYPFFLNEQRRAVLEFETEDQKQGQYAHRRYSCPIHRFGYRRVVFERRQRFFGIPGILIEND